MSLRYAYNTNGAANHRLDDALHLIAGAGYDGVALTPTSTIWTPSQTAGSGRRSGCAGCWASWAWAA